MANPSKSFEFIRLYPSLTADPVDGRVGEIFYNVTMNTLRICVDDSPVTWQDLNLTPYLQARLGIVDYDSYEAYTSVTNIDPSDSYPAALSKLDLAVNAIQTDIAKEEVFDVGIGGTTTITATTITWDTDNAVPDIQVYVNGVKQQQDYADDGSGDYKKTSDNDLLFYYTVPQNARVIIRDERTGAGGGGGGTDLTNIIVDVQPDTNGNHSIGTVTKAWKDIFLKDTSSAQVYKIEIVSGIFTITPVP